MTGALDCEGPWTVNSPRAGTLFLCSSPSAHVSLSSNAQQCKSTDDVRAEVGSPWASASIPYESELQVQGKEGLLALVSLL